MELAATCSESVSALMKQVPFRLLSKTITRIDAADNNTAEKQSPSRQGIDLTQIKSEITNSKVMIVDDEELIIRVVRRFLSANGYQHFVTVTDPRIAIETIRSQRPDVVLLDINMPHVTGMDLLQTRSESTDLQLTPFIVLSANAESPIRQQALKLGATDFLNKPVESAELVLRVQNALMIKRYNDCLSGYANQLEDIVQQRTSLLERSREHIIHCLARAAEFRDNETGEHVIRVGRYSSIIASELGFNSEFCRHIELAAQLHDVGKIGVPDAILLKNGKLSPDEFDIMKKHCHIGAQIIAPIVTHESSYGPQSTMKTSTCMLENSSPMLAMAIQIALTHHEKWDGTGYPRGLTGDCIPLPGRIVCVADVFDALCSERPYKPKFTFKKCLEIMISERSVRFDPVILDAFFKRLPDIERVRRQYQAGIALDEPQ
jgi:putative two-component system response regulator